ncbi:MAG: phosphoribulokinase [Hyphomicrobiales bacterium]|nr:phosphoribulokinase [Hyphomicrobiales bacterium]
MNIDQFARHIIKQAKDKQRFVVAIAGPPGAGKSTAASKLNKLIALQKIRSRIITMDGFHLDNAILRERNLLDRKGAPSTFDVAGFIYLIKRLNSGEDNIIIPKFDRESDVAIAGVEEVTLQDRVLIVEGNYLLLNNPPWAALQSEWNETVFINPGMDILKERLIRRWLNYGLDPDEARKRATNNDLKNAQTVLECSSAADFSFTNPN